MAILRFYRRPALHTGAHKVAVSKIQNLLQSCSRIDLKTEVCYNVETAFGVNLGDEDCKKLRWILETSFESHNFSLESFLAKEENASQGFLFEIGPRLNFSTAWSTNAVSICQSAGIKGVTRIERSRRFLVLAKDQEDSVHQITAMEQGAIVAGLHDRMTECRYVKPIESFEIQVKPEAVYDVDVIGQGRPALEKANKDLGLAFDEWDLDYYTDMFQTKVKRNPTSVECFDLAQSNSEHSRHWFFRGKLLVDGKEHPESLFKMIMSTQEKSNPNNVIKFSDNSSAIEGYKVKALCPHNPGTGPYSFLQKQLHRHVIFTAETHNFPTGVAPFSGATTGTGGRIRDVQAAGRGAHVVAGTAGYCFGNLHIPDYDLPWEDKSFVYPTNMAPGLEVAIEASNGASDYGNKFGEPVLTGFARSFGMMVSENERREWVKPIMFSAGMGSLEASHINKQTPDKDMKVVKLGGPVYRIGVGGGAASSIQVQGDNTEELDFGAVQRGDAEMEQKLNRVIRSCIELGEDNPICSIHDQGAGGNGNVLKEISEPAGALIRAKEFQLGDPTINTMELWGAEYQESNAILVRQKHADLLQTICDREKCPVSFVGDITGDGKIRLEVESDVSDAVNGAGESAPKKSRSLSYPVDLDLELVLGSIPPKEFKMECIPPKLKPLSLPAGLTVRNALDRVLRLPSVASKRYLTNKVDRSVTGLVAQQQCVGPLHTPLADVAVTALSHFETVGSATAIGEQPIKGLIDAGTGARMSVAESLTNLVFARVSSLKDVKCSGNWMWPAKLPGEGVALLQACQAMCDVMKELGIAIDGGKDSLSMAARVSGDTVKAPGALVISTYVCCPDITATITPDLKCPDDAGTLLYVDLSNGNHRLGGSALAQCYQQLGDSVPDLDKPALLVAAFEATQELLADGVLTSGHDVSDGGLITCLLEMAFAGNVGIEVNVPNETKAPAVDVLFAEELGLVLEASSANAENVCLKYTQKGVPCTVIGRSIGQGPDAKVKVSVGGEEVLNEKMTVMRDIWEETSFKLERHQTNPECVTEEETGMATRMAPPYNLTFDPNVHEGLSNQTLTQGHPTPKVAVIREEGSNGDREMVASLFEGGFEVWDVNMQDLASKKITLEDFRGVVFVGGFSYADVCDSAKGWAAAILFNPTVRAQFDAFKARSDTFSLGVCNGCQLMALLGWIAPNEDVTQSANQNGESTMHSSQGLVLSPNQSERFESRFVTVKIQQSPAIMLQGMQDSVLGIWIAHGDGQMKFKSDSLLDKVKGSNLTPMQYVDDQGNPTMQYPLNPNGSPEGIAALCSPDGRHLAMMPHPERCTQVWQWPWMPSDWKAKVKVSPWKRMFQNAALWCHQNL